jgi:hypothetical protein
MGEVKANYSYSGAPARRPSAIIVKGSGTFTYMIKTMRQTKKSMFHGKRWAGFIIDAGNFGGLAVSYPLAVVIPTYNRRDALNQ